MRLVYNKPVVLTAHFALQVVPSNGSLYASPLATHWGIVCATLDGWLISLNGESGAAVWMLSLGQPLFTTPILSPDLDLLYVGCVSRTFYAVSARHGTVVWQFATAAPIFSSPVLHGQNSVLFGCHDHHLYLLDAASGRLIWKRELDSEIFASPDFDASGRIVAATVQGSVYLIDSDGEVLSSFKPGGHVFSSPLFISGRIMVGSRDNFLYCYKEEYR